MGVFKSIKVIALIVIHLNLKLILIGRQVIVLILLLIIRVVDFMVVIVTIFLRNDIVASEVDGVGTRNLEEDTLMLANGDIERLLEVLGCVKGAENKLLDLAVLLTILLIIAGGLVFSLLADFSVRAIGGILHFLIRSASKGVHELLKSGSLSSLL